MKKWLNQIGPAVRRCMLQTLKDVNYPNIGDLKYPKIYVGF